MEENKYKNIGYVSLHNHTSYSILDALSNPMDLFKKAKEIGQEAIAVTDHGSLAGLWDSLAASKATGVKLIPGVEIHFCNDLNDKDERLRHVILLAKNQVGYKNLLLLVAEGFDNSKISLKKVTPRVTIETLKKYKDGLICLTGSANGILGLLINEKKSDEALEQAEILKEIFGEDFAIELQPHALKRQKGVYSGEIDQVLTNKKLKEISQKINVKCVVTTNSHYIDALQSKSHDVLLAIAAGSTLNSGQRLKYDKASLHLKTEEDVYNKLYRTIYDKEFALECIKNTKFFSDKCETPHYIDPKFTNPSGKELPEFPVKDQKDYNEFLEWKNSDDIFLKSEISLNEDDLYYRFRCSKGLSKKLLKGDLKKENYQEYADRIFLEIDVLETLRFTSYMLIVMDYIEWAKDNGIFVGTGRGSVGGSFTAYLCGIHISDPFKYGLFFERFLNKEKASMPDIDQDFCSAGTDQVMEYIKSKYGEDHVARVSNVNTMTPKVYTRAIARTFMYGGDRKTAVKIGTALADTIPSDVKYVQKSFDQVPLLNEFAKPIEEGGGGYVELKQYSKDIGNQIASWSTHAAGLVVGARPLRGLVPIRRDKDHLIALEYEKEKAEANGLVKMDVLGLGTLDIIQETIRLIELSEKKPPVNHIDFDYDQYDKAAYDLISSGDTLCVFQFGGSPGTVALCKALQPKTIEDLAVINTLARPGAKDIRQDYILTKDGQKKPEYMHKYIEDALKDTFGFCCFEEQLMKIAALANWTKLQSDNLRKLTKMKGKDPDKAEKWRLEFIEGAIKNNVSKEIAEKTWDNIIEPMSRYSFNKSHAVLYSMVGFYTAYLKAHFTLEFLVANLKAEVESNAPDSKDNIAKIKEGIRALSVNIIQPDINKSEMTYKIIDDHTLMTGFDAVKFVGKDAIPEIISKRPFSSFEDFLTRCDRSKVKAPSIQALAASGCLDSFGISRKDMFFYAADYKKKLQAHLKKAQKNPGKWGEFSYPWPNEGDWRVSEKCALERFYVGEYLSGNKVAAFGGFFKNNALSYKMFSKIHPPPKPEMSEKDIKKYTKNVSLIQGEVKDLSEFKVKKEDSKIRGEVMAIMKIEDPHGNQIRVTLFPNSWVKLQQRCKDLSGGKSRIEVGCGLFINGKLNWYNSELCILFDEVVKFSPPPQLPTDLKSKQLNIKQLKKQAEEDKKEEAILDDRDILLNEVEEDLVDMGNSDLDDDLDEDF